MKLTCWTTSQGMPILLEADALPPIIRYLNPDHGRMLSADAKNFAQCLNIAARAAGNGLLLTLPPDTETLDPAWQ